MEYGNRKIGYNEIEKCPKCKWEGYRSKLEKSYVFADDSNEEIDAPIDEHWVCPICKTIIE